MKILFVCKGNVSRSQMAETFYNDLTHSHDADSAGVEADHAGKTLAERRELVGGKSNTIDVMAEAGFDISANVQTFLTKEMLGKYDQVVNMCDESIVPKWLITSPKYVYWEITDPVGHDIEFTRNIRDQIKQKVEIIL